MGHSEIIGVYSKSNGKPLVVLTRANLYVVKTLLWLLGRGVRVGRVNELVACCRSGCDSVSGDDASNTYT